MLKRIQVYNGIRIELIITDTKTKQTRRSQMRINVANKRSSYERVGLQLLWLRKDLLTDMLDKNITCTMKYYIRHKYTYKYIKAKDILL